jgi:hypothetical protein
MHELSVALSILEVAAEEAERHGSARGAAVQPGRTLDRSGRAVIVR